jgi:predicted nuclease with TOPRIM domain
MQTARKQNLIPAALVSALASCCLALLVAGISGCSSEPAKTGKEQLQANAIDLRDTLRNTIKDAGRLQQMQAIADQNAAEMQLRVEELARLRKEEVRLNANYDASKDEFRQLGDRIQSVRKQYRSLVIRTRTELAQLTTDDEWKKITSRDLAIFNN